MLLFSYKSFMPFSRYLVSYGVRSTYLLGLGLASIFCSVSEAQISIVNSGAGSNAVNVNGAYIQNFNTLPTTGTNAWTDNSTLPGCMPRTAQRIRPRFIRVWSVLPPCTGRISLTMFSIAFRNTSKTTPAPQHIGPWV